MARPVALFAIAVLAGLGAAWLLTRHEEPARAAAARATVPRAAPPPPMEHTEKPATPAPAAAPGDDETQPQSEEAFLRKLAELERDDKPRALAWAERGDSWYGASGRAAEARQAMKVTLLVDLGRMDEARARTREFIAAYPDSEYRHLVQGVTGIHPRPGKPAP